MEYRGFGSLIRPDEDGGFHGRVTGIRDVVNFYGATTEELRAEFEKSVDVYLAFRQEHNRRP